MIRLFRFLKPYTMSIAGVLLLVFVQSLAQLYLPTLMADIVDVGIVSGDTPFILRVGGIMLLVALVGGIATIASSYLSAKASAGFGKDLRNMVFSRVESFSLHEFDNIGTASLITRTTNDITQMQQVAVMMLRLMIMAPMMSIGGIIMAVSKDAELSRIIIFVLPVLGLAIYLIASKGLPLFKVMQSKLDKVNLVAREGLTGVRVIRAFNRIDHEKERTNNANLDLTDTAIKVNRIMASAMPVMMLVMNLTTVAIVWFGSIRIDNGSMQVGDLMAFIQYVMQIMFSLLMVSMMFVMVPRASASATRINEILDTVPEIVDSPNPEKSFDKKGYVEFDNVSFRYPGAEKPAIENISFSAGPGEVTAIIGGTGSGKSTLLSLLLRFYDVEQGLVSVDGIDIRNMSQEMLRSKIGYVSQKAILFTGTVSANIRYGKEDATDGEIRQAAETAQAMEFIAGMKDGFDSEISQGGTNISGGQKQRLSIARALVRRPEVVIFDDSFSALDFKTDARLRAALRDVIVDSTVIIVAQRVNTVINADRIIVMEEGNIVAQGKHKELLETSQVYREIVASQLSEEELA